MTASSDLNAHTTFDHPLISKDACQHPVRRVREATFSKKQS